jgi:hypothetical protein
MRSVTTFLAIVVLCMASAGIAVSADDGAQRSTLPYVTLTGKDSHITRPSYHHVTSESEWNKVWRRHRGEKESLHYDLVFDPDLPEVNFDKCVVIAVFRGVGQRNAGLKTIGLTEEKDKIVLKLLDMWYQTAGRSYHRTPGNSSSGQEDVGKDPDVTVYGFFVIPKSNKPIMLEEYHRTIGSEELTLDRRTRLPQ